ncbi:hypothetical protein [Streptomyces sp. KMM 9044]|uniref:hypothetical protein n=1 Tax=Streptomyces sp. KMM 9044 TaxID=2744474 RepID=UPI0021516707|nr:hypothetical protein [Streptomyces sp. KMM 9044]WAX79405.1 hypothetical protein HUV60_018790 [Streptomyces sp. KMM 9044]
MGIESDQVVYEYLSRVGDVAQQRQLPSATRMRLVAGLRDEIDRRRAKAVVDSPAAVRRIISRMGTPDEVVTAASSRTSGGTSDSTSGTEEAAFGTEGNGGATPSKPVPAPAAVPVQRVGDRGRRAKSVLRRAVPRPRPADGPPATPAPPSGPSAPHRAGMDELGDSATQPDWWRTDSSPFGVGDEVPGFVGGVEIPELLKAPPATDDAPGADRRPDGPRGNAPAPVVVEAGNAKEKTGSAFRCRLPRLPSGGRSNPLLLVAAGLLVVGAVLGNWFALLLGWVIVSASRRLSQAEIKWAVLVLPGLAIAGGATWLWGRTGGRWGTPIADGALDEAVQETWPWVVRAAAVASALFLTWRSQRPR